MNLEPVIQSEESQRKTSFVYSHEYNFIYMESRKTVLMNLFAGQTEQTLDTVGEGESGMN